MDVTAGDHAGTAALVSRTNQIIFSRPGPTPRIRMTMICSRRHISKRVTHLLSAMKFGLDEVSREYSFDAHAATSADGLTLFFVSDRPGGLGGTDIWQ